MNLLKLLISILIGALLLPQVWCFSSSHETTKEWHKLAKRVNEIIAGTYAPQSSTVNIISTTNTPSDILDEAMKNIFKIEDISAVLESSSNIRSSDLRIWNVFLIDSLKSFMEIYDKMSPKLFEYHGYYTIVSTSGIINEADKIFELLWSKQIYNCVLLFFDTDTVKAVTFNPFSPQSCNDVKSVEVSKANIFDNKVKDLKDCPVNVHAPDWAPFIYLKNGTIKGRDYEFIKALSKIMNFKLNLTVLAELASWGMLYDNGTATGAIKNLFDSKADILIGDYYLRSVRVKYMDASAEYFNADIVFVIPPGRDLVSIEKLLQPFSRPVWIVLTLTILTFFLAAFIANKLSKNILQMETVACCFYILSVLFAVSLRRQPKRSVARMLFILIVMFCIVKQAIYQGLLFKFLQTETKLRDVQSIDEMTERKYNFYIYDSMYEQIQSDKRIMDR